MSINKTQYSQSTKNLKFGVSRGSALGPFMYENFLPFCNPTTDFVLFADDTNVAKGSKNYEDLEQSSEDAKLKVSDWFNAHPLSSNMSDTEKCFFGLGQHPAKNSDSVKILGVQLERSLTQHTHANYIAGKLSTNKFILRNLVNNDPEEVQTLAQYDLKPYLRYPSMGILTNDLRRVFGENRLDSLRIHHQIRL